jgi:hypothetical protein
MNGFCSEKEMFLIGIFLTSQTKIFGMDVFASAFECDFK